MKLRKISGIEGKAFKRNNEVDLLELQEQRRRSNKSPYCKARVKRKLEYWRIRLKCNLLQKLRGKKLKGKGIWELPAARQGKRK